MFYPHKKTANTNAIYHLDGDANDASGNANNLTITGATLDKGRFGQAYHFDNDDNTTVEYGKLAGTSASLNRVAGNQITIAFWVRFTKQPSETSEPNYRFIGYGQNTGGNSGQYLLIYTGSALNFIYNNAGETATYWTGITKTLSNNVWYHCVITYTYPTTSDATKPLFYVDGVNITANAWNATPDGTLLADSGVFTLGNDNYGITTWTTDNRGMNGELDEVIIDEAIWSAAEVRARYNKGRMIYPH